MKYLILTSSLCLYFLICGCEKKNDPPDTSPKVETARLDLYILSNYKYPVFYLDHDSLGRLLNINQHPEYAVPLYYPCYVLHGHYIVTAIVNRNPANPMLYMLDSDSTWVKVIAVLNGDTVATGTGGPMPGSPLKSSVSISFDY